MYDGSKCVDSDCTNQLEGNAHIAVNAHIVLIAVKAERASNTEIAVN